ncbi:MAG TPA: hypothetical protein VFS92_00025 [Planctomycetota bacterium]|nr:hypothetical protein [Planctomycetota bacterium]
MKSLQRLGLASLATVALVAGAIAAPPDQGLTGAIFTTDVNAAVNHNIYDSKLDVYLNGGPQNKNSAGLPGGYYYVQVTDPSGQTLLGTSVGTANPTPIHVTDGEFDENYQLWSIVSINGVQGYDDTPNNGGEYKVWVSEIDTFDQNRTKTDNFKVKESEDDDEEDPVDPIVHVYKFYDANANGTWDSDESAIEGWKIEVAGASGYTDVVYTSWTATLDADDYTFTEGTPVETNWLHTTPESVSLTLENGDEEDVTFGNLCLGAGGGYTLGFWSNKNGQKLIGSDDLAALRDLNLVGYSGSAFDPTSAAQVKSWLLSGNAVNMSYMLSVQLCAMKLNVYNGSASGSSLVYAPGLGTSGLVDVDGDGTSDFISVADLIAAADAELATHSTAYSGDAWRGYQEALKNALDAGNNNLNFVQSTPGAFSF